MLKCVLKSGPSCVDSYSGKTISISAEKPFQINASRETLFGYKDEQFCMECSNEGTTIVSKEIKVTQTSKCQTQLLSVKEDAITESKFEFSSTSPSEIIGTWESFI